MRQHPFSLTVAVWTTIIESAGSIELGTPARKRVTRPLKKVQQVMIDDFQDLTAEGATLLVLHGAGKRRVSTPIIRSHSAPFSDSILGARA